MKKGSMIWIYIIITFLLLNLNGGIACAISFWVIYGLAWLLPQKKTNNAKMSLWEEEQLQHEETLRAMRFGKMISPYWRKWLEEMRDKGRAEELKKYYDKCDFYELRELKHFGYYFLDNEGNVVKK